MFPDVYVFLGFWSLLSVSCNNYHCQTPILNHQSPCRCYLNHPALLDNTTITLPSPRTSHRATTAITTPRHAITTPRHANTTPRHANTTTPDTSTTPEATAPTRNTDPDQLPVPFRRATRNAASTMRTPEIALTTSTGACDIAALITRFITRDIR